MSELSLDQILNAVQPPAPAFKPTEEQEAIIEAGKNLTISLMIDAKAGCAKTTTLTLLAKALPVKPSLALAFNVKIKKELEKKFPSHFQVKTLNGLGHSAWGAAIGKRCIVETGKLVDILKGLAEKDDLGGRFGDILQLVRKARSMGLVPQQFHNVATGLFPDTYESWEEVADELYLDVSDEVVFYCQAVLTESIRQAYQGVIDYDDQIYMSALFNGRFSRYPVVMVDEAQDLSPLNHIQLRKSASDRLIVVGDPRQAIYAFRGADSNSMENMRALREEWLDLPLSTTFRCPKVIVERQQTHAPGFTAAETNVQGEVQNWMGKGEDESWTIANIETLPKPVAILCRNNAPLLACALRIIRSGRGCTIMGGEIGKQLVNLSRKILPEDDIPFQECIDKIELWRRNEVAKARAQEKEERVGIINDRAECLLAVLERTSGVLRYNLSTMFSKENLNIILATGHKAKGLEWPSVIHLDPWRIPSKWAKRALDTGHTAPMKQEMNLRYVIETRTQGILVLANFEDMG